MLTLVALVIGHRFYPLAYVPQTAQMFAANVVCDFLSFVFSIGLLLGAVTPEARPAVWSQSEISRLRLPKLPIPTAVAADLGIALVFACLSLWCGLVFTNHAIPATAVLRTLIGRSISGREWAFGPYFWVMHTTFILTLLYLGAILVTLIAKAGLAPTRWLLERFGNRDINPIRLVASLMALAGASLGALRLLLGIMRSL
ncbi:MAG TPA: hypothetical protein VII23_24600 [Terriglobales bacterium]